MFSFKPKPVLGEACIAICFLLVLAVFEPAFAKSGGKSDLVHPELVGNLAHSGMGKISLASFKIDTASQYNGQIVDIPILIRNDVKFGNFEGVYALYDSGKTGDINLNGITYEVADWVLFQNFLLYGDSMLIDPEQQTHNSDVNCDHLPWSIADLLYLCWVILREAIEIPCKAKGSALSEYIAHPQDNTDQFTLVSSSAHPGQVVSVPVWLSNSIIADGVTFKVIFDSTVLSVEGIDTAQTRIAGWEEIEPVINPGELFFFAHPDWWLFPHPPGIGPGKGTLIRINFRINANTPPGTFLPITFQTEPNRGHYNAYTDTIGLTLVQPPPITGWVFTDVISGDVNSDGIVDVVDLVYLINYLYMAGIPPSPMSLGDFTQDSKVNLGDVVALVNYIFRS